MPPDPAPPIPAPSDPGPGARKRLLAEAWVAYRLRWKRRRLLFRAFRKRGQLSAVSDRTRAIRDGDVLCLSTMRNERDRLPYFLAHHRRLGVAHFLIVDNASTDGTRELLAAQSDVSLWHTDASYRLSRFGMDWLTWLMIRHGHGHWCLTLDADEVLIYPYWETRDLRALTGWLDGTGQQALPAMMLDLYPEGRLSAQPAAGAADQFKSLCWFDRGNLTIRRQEPLGNLWVQGGPRARQFFAQDPRRAPTLNKTPLVRWNRRFVYVNSTHQILPRRLHQTHAAEGGEMPSGLILHTKFMPSVVSRSQEECHRAEHFANSALHADYYDKVAADPRLWCETSTRLTGWRGLEAMGLMSRGGWI